MATLPRSPKSSKFIPSSAAQRRPHSEFDAGINASTAWTEHLESTGSLSDEEPDTVDEEGTHRPARALYDFEGKGEFRELSVDAGDEIEVVKEDLADGWSLVKNEAGEVGLLPRTYYTVRPFERSKLADS
jgi:sorting nexin-9/18/33